MYASRVEPGDQRQVQRVARPDTRLNGAPVGVEQVEVAERDAAPRARAPRPGPRRCTGSAGVTSTLRTQGCAPMALGDRGRRPARRGSVPAASPASRSSSVSVARARPLRRDALRSAKCGELPRPSRRARARSQARRGDTPGAASAAQRPSAPRAAHRGTAPSARGLAAVPGARTRTSAPAACRAGSAPARNFSATAL